MTWIYQRSARMLGILIAASGLVACDVSDIEDVSDEELLDMELRTHDTVLPFPHVEITALDSEVVLRWGPRPGATYSVYRGTQPDFIYGTLVASGLTGGEHSEPFAPHAPNARYYRVVEHKLGYDTHSAVVGRIPIPVRLAASHAYSKIPVCLEPTPFDSHQQMLLEEHPLSISWWEPLQQAFAFDFWPFDSVLDLELLDFYAVRTAPVPYPQIVRYQVTGAVATTQTFLAHEGIHAVVWPLTEDPTMASDLLDPFMGVVGVGRWSSIQQRVEWYRSPNEPIANVPGVVNVNTGDFAIDPCTPLYVFIDELHHVSPYQKVPVPWPFLGHAH